MCARRSNSQPQTSPQPRRRNFRDASRVNGGDSAALKLVLDRGIPTGVASPFRQLGYECLHVSEEGMQQAEDEDILAFARERDSIAITLDADFHALVAVRHLVGPD